ncbi:acyl-CoA reductase [Larkinella terrae]|uniref:Acyl-CoA reductase n=1 Tax=Larkinella terrae TaxID=2025311 RepID=A0A7K0ELC1_9BACT|nr:acyl-CoA reductase [Larkinella terrae]MRS62617.1 acyl-CoA reductase [Larkinella terrae]
MNLNDRITTFVRLGQFLKDPENAPELQEIAEKAYYSNHWFTTENCAKAIQAIADEYLNEEKLSAWIKGYNVSAKEVKNVGVVMAGNIPAVGFHDLLCVLLSGHRLLAKLSTPDFVLINYFIKKIIEINPNFAERIQISERLNQADAYIATGSSNSARYFEYYFSKKPHIIRKNRSSVAILTNRESEVDFEALGHDVLDYFGLGCRNVSTVFVPEHYDFVPFLKALEPLAFKFTSHHKFNNNYDYNKSINLINAVPHFDNGFLLVLENEGLVSPISTLYFQTYSDLSQLEEKLEVLSARIQCVASKDGFYPGSVPLGNTQRPGLGDYADGVDTMAFLERI